jgi:hypothetical protein
MSSQTVAPPDTLTELQSYTPEQIQSVDAYQYRSDLSPKRFIKGIIELASKEVSWQGEANANSLRNFWYNPVKPLVETAFPQKLEKPGYNFGRRMSQYLSEALSELVLDGEVTYRALNILDDSRQRDLRTGGIEHDKILFVEKDAAYRKLRPLANVYAISLVSGSGWQATALIEDLAHELDSGTDYQLFVLSDYDPTGFNIVNDFRRRSTQLGILIETVERVAISPDQLDAATLETQRFTPPVNSERDERWLAEYGIEGKYGLEIEAIGGLTTGGQELRRVAVEALRPHIREDARISLGLNNMTARIANEVIETVVADLTSELTAVLQDETAAMLRNRGAVDSVDTFNDGTFSVRVNLDAVRSGGFNERDRYLPTPPDEGDLHDGAVSGDRPSYGVGMMREAVKNCTGELRVERYLYLTSFRPTVGPRAKEL